MRQIRYKWTTFTCSFFRVILMDRLIEKTEKKNKENNNNSDKKNMRISDRSLFKSTNHVFLRFRCLLQGYLVFSYRLSLILSFSFFFLLSFSFQEKQDTMKYQSSIILHRRHEIVQLTAIVGI